MNRDLVKVRNKDSKRIVQETTGKLSDKEILEQEGKLQKTAGKVQAGYGDLKDDVKKDK
jgi:uncharacterized protein YjbJ (UPF0337 family)